MHGYHGAEGADVWRDLQGKQGRSISVYGRGGIANLAQKPAQLAGYEGLAAHARANGAD